ncbi:MAG: GTP-binding protein, partial [Planctomycetota bacterium]
MPSVDKIRNVVVAGHSTSGKTALIEHLLNAGGAISRVGTIDDGNTVCDSDDQEKERKHSIDLACAHLEKDGIKVNFIDTPGYRDFLGQYYCAVAVADCVVVVVSADDGVQPTTRKVWEIAEKLNLPRVVVINRMDREHANFEEVLGQIQEQLSSSAVPAVAADGNGGSFSAVTSLVGSDADGANDLMEAVVETDEALMERYLEGEEPSTDELSAAFAGAVGSAAFFPVYPTSASSGVGIDELLGAIQNCVPSAAANTSGREVHPLDNAEETSPVPTGDGDPLCARVFKVVSDPYVGKLSYLRIFSGSLETNGSFINPHSGKPEKAGKIVYCQGSEQTGCDKATAGDIVALVKVESLKAFDIITSDKPLAMAPPPVPR